MNITPEQTDRLKQILEKLFKDAEKQKYTSWRALHLPKTPKQTIQKYFWYLCEWANDMPDSILYQLEEIITEIYIQNKETE